MRGAWAAVARVCHGVEGAGLVALEPGGGFRPEDDAGGRGVLRAFGGRSRRMREGGQAVEGGSAGARILLEDPGELAVPLEAGPGGGVFGGDVDVGLQEDGVIGGR